MTNGVSADTGALFRHSRTTTNCSDRRSRPQIGTAPRLSPGVAGRPEMVSPRISVKLYFLSGRAKTHNTDPPSGTVSSGVSVASDLAWLEPLPDDTATYCLPFTL